MAIVNLIDTERWLDWFNKMNEMIDELNLVNTAAVQAQLDAYEANQIPINFDYDETLTSTTFSTFAGTYIKGSASYDVLANSFVIANDDTTTIYIDLTDDTIKGVLTSAVATSGIIPLYEVTVAANVQTLVKDLRTAANHTLYETAAELLAAIKTVDGPTSGLNADLLDDLEATSFLRSDASDDFEGSVLSMSNAGAMLGMDSKTAPDGFSFRRITCNDGGGNWNFQSGSYFNVSDKFTVTGDGAVLTRINTDGANGSWEVKVADTGTADATISWAATLKLDNTGLFVDGNKVYHAGNDGPGSGLNADEFDGLNSSAYMKTANNLSDLADNPTARTNLDVYSKAESDSAAISMAIALG